MTMPLNEEHVESSEQQVASDEQQAASQSSAELIQEVIVVAQDMGARYKKQLGMSAELVQREWHLSLRALLMAVAGILFLVIVGSIIWLGLNGLLALILIKLNVQMAIIVVLLVLLNTLTAAALIVLIRKLLAQVGFKRSWSAITMSNSD
jgi:hypothetical protein